MEYYEYQDTTIPKIGIGTSGLSGQNCINVIQMALSCGYRFIDTARRYNNHREIGEAINQSEVNREEIFISTKIWRNDLRYDNVIRKTKQSLKELDTDYIDLLLIHWPSQKVDLSDTLAAMKELRSKGHIKNIGVSNFTNSQFIGALSTAEEDLLANEVLHNPFNKQKSLLETCRNEEKLLIAYSPLAKGVVAQNNVLQKIGKKYERSPVQVALRWLTQQENVVAIPKARTQKHLKENIRVFDFNLEEKDVKEITEIKPGLVIRSLHKLPSLMRSIPM